MDPKLIALLASINSIVELCPTLVKVLETDEGKVQLDKLVGYLKEEHVWQGTIDIVKDADKIARAIARMK